MNQKNENMLNVALGTSENLRQKTIDLNVGYNEEQRTWEVIVKYYGDIKALEERYEGTKVEVLLSGYAIIIARESFIEEILEEPVILYAEKPKNFYFGLELAKRRACIEPLYRTPYNLSGQGVLVAVLDSGIDIFLEEFQDGEGNTRIVSLWDQIAEGTPPIDFLYGSLYTEEEINRAIQLGRVEGRSLVPSQDTSGHGTAVANIVAGSQGVAPQSELVVVKLGNQNDSFPRTTRIMEGITFAVREATRLGKPLVINMSFGNNYGPHNGNSVLEEFLNEVANLGRISIVVGNGNEGNAGIHARGRINELERVELSVGEFETKLNLQIWKQYADRVKIYVETPMGQRIGPIERSEQIERFESLELVIQAFQGQPTPYNLLEEVYMDFLPVGDYIPEGVYVIRIEAVEIVDGRYDMWLPSNSVLSRDTRFLVSDPYGTITVPATAKRTISVGAIDGDRNIYADFSGRGIQREEGNGFENKPDVVAEGVGIQTIYPGGEKVEVSGTSFATPIVAGSAALLMEWGIVKGNDLYLYGEKLKAYLAEGAKKVSGIKKYPGPLVGWGNICIRDSLPE